MCLSISEVRGSFINVDLIAILESKYPRQSVIPICQPARAHTAVRITTQLVTASDRDVKWLCTQLWFCYIWYPRAFTVANKFARTHAHRLIKKWSANVRKLYLSNPHRYIHKSNKLSLAGRIIFLSSSVTLRCLAFGVSGSQPIRVYSMSWLFLHLVCQSACSSAVTFRWQTGATFEDLSWERKKLLPHQSTCICSSFYISSLLHKVLILMEFCSFMVRWLLACQIDLPHNQIIASLPIITESSIVFYEALMDTHCS